MKTGNLFLDVLELIDGCLRKSSYGHDSELRKVIQKNLVKVRHVLLSV